MSTLSSEIISNHKKNSQIFQFFSIWTIGALRATLSLHQSSHRPGRVTNNVRGCLGDLGDPHASTFSPKIILEEKKNFGFSPIFSMSKVYGWYICTAPTPPFSHKSPIFEVPVTRVLPFKSRRRWVRWKAGSNPHKLSEHCFIRFVCRSGSTGPANTCHPLLAGEELSIFIRDTHTRARETHFDK